MFFISVPGTWCTTTFFIFTCRYVLRFIGEGQSGAISCEESRITLGDTIVGEKVRTTIRLHNDSNCALIYQLHLQHTATDPSNNKDGSSVAMENNKDGSVVAMDNNNKDGVLQLDHYEGLIPSCSNRVVELLVQPKHQLLYNCTISYSLKGNTG